MYHRTTFSPVSGTRSPTPDSSLKSSRQAQAGGASFVDNQVPPPCEQARGQLLRVLTNDSMRGTLEDHFGMKLAFQNCHRVAFFQKDRLDRSYEAFISPRSQLLNQSPDLVDC